MVIGQPLKPRKTQLKVVN